MLNRVLTRVDLPKPDSPIDGQVDQSSKISLVAETLTWMGKTSIPTTMQVNWKPFLTLFLCTWLGRFANPTYPISFLRMMGGMPAWLGTEDVEPFAIPFTEAAISPLGVPG